MSEVVAAAPVAASPTPAATTAPVGPAKQVPSSPSEAKPEAAPEAKAAALFHDITIDGKKQRVTTDQLLKMAELGGAANRRFEEAAKMRKEAEAIISRSRNPKDAIKQLSDPKLGLKKEEIAAAMEEWYTENVIAESEMTPEQREHAAAKRRLAEYDQKEKAEADRLAAEQEQAKDAAEIKKVQQEIIDTLEESGLPKTGFVVSRMAHWIRVNENKNLNAPRSLLIEQVRGEMRNNLLGLTEAADGEMLVNLLGEGTVKKLRKYDLDQIRSKRGQSTAQPPKPVQLVQNQPERLSIQEMKRRERDPNLWK